MQGHQLASFLVLVLAVGAGCGSDDTQSATATGGSTSGSGGSGGSGGTTAGGGSGGTTAAGGSDGGQSPGGASSVDLDDLGTPCDDGQCPPGLNPVEFCGILGCDEMNFCSCEIPCEDDSEICPEGTTCATVSDGPGEVCVRN